MATTSIADKLAKLEKKIAKRQATIADEQSDDDTDSTSTVGDTAVKHSSFPRNNMSEGALNE